MNIINEVRLVQDEKFSGLKISSNDFLDEIKGRTQCGQCNKSRKYFCYSCYLPMNGIKNRIPQVELPFYVDIIKHPREVDGKSTATHAAVLAPHQVNMYTYPDFPFYQDKSKVLLIFPGKKAITLEDVKRWKRDGYNTDIDKTNSGDKPRFPNVTLETVENSCSQCGSSIHNSNIRELETRCNQVPEANGDDDATKCASDCKSSSHLRDSSEHYRRGSVQFPFDRVIFIDSTWNQVQTINNDERLQGIPRVELKNRESLFWRFQRGKPRNYLSTIEAIYYFLVDTHVLFTERPYQGEYDNMLFFFHYMYKKIHTLYDPTTLRVNTMS